MQGLLAFYSMKHAAILLLRAAQEKAGASTLQSLDLRVELVTVRMATGRFCALLRVQCCKVTVGCPPSTSVMPQ
jgi:hypothetical protein